MASPNTLLLYSTTVSDTGYVRSNNQDSSFAGQRLIAVCDGMGGHAGGDTASTIAVRSLAGIEREPATPQTVGDVASLLENSVIAAHDAIVGNAKRDHKLAGMGTTVTAVCLVEDHWVLAHIGDSRAYLLRAARLIRATKDHSYVQHLIDTGRITPDEAKNHPQKNVVMRVLGDFDIDPRPDISVRKALAGDRWMLCSDGVCGVLSDETIRETLQNIADPQECAQRLVAMALKAGSTDNCTAVVADATIPLDSTGDNKKRHQVPLVGGAVSADLAPLADAVGVIVAQALPLKDEYTSSPAQKAAELASLVQEEQRDSREQETPTEPAQSSSESSDRSIADTGDASGSGERDDDEDEADTGDESRIAADDNSADENAGEITGVWDAGDLQKRESAPRVAADDSDGTGGVDNHGTPSGTDETDTVDEDDETPTQPETEEEAAAAQTGSTGAPTPAVTDTAAVDEDEETDTLSEELKNVKIAVPQSMKSNDDDIVNTSEIPIVLATDGTQITDPHDPRVKNAIEKNNADKARKARLTARRHRLLIVVIIALIVAVIAAIIAGMWRWSQSQYYVGESDGYVAIYQGTNTNIFGVVKLSHVVQKTGILVSNLPENSRQQITNNGLTASSLEEAQGLLVPIVQQNAQTVNGDNPAEPSATMTSVPTASATSSGEVTGEAGDGSSETPAGGDGSSGESSATEGASAQESAAPSDTASAAPSAQDGREERR